MKIHRARLRSRIAQSKYLVIVACILAVVAAHSVQATSDSNGTAAYHPKKGSLRRQFNAKGKPSGNKKAAKGIFLLGANTYETFIPGTINAGQSDIFLMALDQYGDMTWGIETGGTSFEGAALKTPHAMDPRGNHYIFAHTQSDPSWTSTVCPTCGGQDLVVLKFTNNGRMLWATQIGSPATDIPSTIRVSKSGRVFIAGTTFGTLPGAIPLESYQGPRMFVAEIDARDGSLVWVTNFAGHDAPGGQYYHMYGEPDDILLVDAKNALYVMYHTPSNSAKQTTYIRKMQPGSFDYVWEYEIGNTNAVFTSFFMPDKTQTIVLAGYTWEALLGESGQVVPLLSGGPQGYIVQVDASTGAFKGLTYQASTVFDAVADPVNPGNIIITGLLDLEGTRLPTTPITAYIASISATGERVWIHNWSVLPSLRSGVNAGHITLDNVGGVYFAGFFTFWGDYNVLRISKVSLTVGGGLAWSVDIKAEPYNAAVNVKSLFVEGADGLYVVGSVSKGGFEGYPNSGHDTTYKDACVVKVNTATGEVVWLKYYGGDGDEVVAAGGLL